MDGWFQRSIWLNLVIFPEDGTEIVPACECQVPLRQYIQGEFSWCQSLENSSAQPLRYVVLGRIVLQDACELFNLV